MLTDFNEGNSALDRPRPVAVAPGLGAAGTTTTAPEVADT